jgi:hypothetical protein
MTKLQKRLAHCQAMEIDLVEAFAEHYFGTDNFSVKSGVLGVEVQDILLAFFEIREYIEAEATTDEIIEHYNYCAEHRYVRFDYWRSEIKPKTETQPVEVRKARLGKGKNKE